MLRPLWVLALDARNEARADPNAAGAQHEGGCEAASVVDAATGHEHHRLPC